MAVHTFQKFAKINDRHFKLNRPKPPVEPEKVDEQQGWEDTSTEADFYSDEAIGRLEENDEIDSVEAGFMRGFLEA